MRFIEGAIIAVAMILAMPESRYDVRQRIGVTMIVLVFAGKFKRAWNGKISPGVDS